MKRKTVPLTRLSRNFHRPSRPVRLRRRARWWRWVMAIGVVTLLILGWTWKGVYVDALRIKKARLLVEIDEVQGRQKHLISHLTSLRSFARIDRLARNELHMQYANHPARILEVPGLKVKKHTQVDAIDHNRTFASIK